MQRRQVALRNGGLTWRPTGPAARVFFLARNGGGRPVGPVRQASRNGVARRAMITPSDAFRGDRS